MSGFKKSEISIYSCKINRKKFELSNIMFVFASRLPLGACRSVLEQDTEPQIAPDEQLVPCMAASVISVYECVCEWGNLACIVKCFELSLEWKSTIKMQTIYHLLENMCVCHSK